MKTLLGLFLTTLFLSQATLAGVFSNILYFGASSSELKYQPDDLTVPQNSFNIQQNFVDIDNNKIVLWSSISSEKSDSPIVFYLHGNGEVLDEDMIGSFFTPLKLHNLDGFAIDYPGFKNSTGKPNMDSVVSSALQSYLEIERRYPNRKIAVLGWSLGAAVSIQLTQHINENPSFHSLTLLAGADNYKNVCIDKLGFFGKAVCGKATSGDEYNAAELAPRIKVPVMIQSSQADTMIRSKRTEALIDLFSNNKELLDISIKENQSHNQLMNLQFWNEFSEFINRQRVPLDKDSIE